MALAEPPRQPPGEPVVTLLPKGTVVYRVYHVRYGPVAFKQRVAVEAERGHSAPGGARFDGTTADPYSFLYAGSTPGVAIAETLLRDAAFTDSGTRTVLACAIAPLGCVPIEVTHAVQLVDLRGGRALAALGATAALVHSPERDYPVTRRWARRIREWCPDVMGLVWRSRWEPDGDAYVLFGDRLAAIGAGDEPVLRAIGRHRREFGSDAGKTWLRNRLLEYHTDLR